MDVINRRDNFRASIIVTVLNEQKSIGKLLKSFDTQSLIPTEVIIIDGGSKDRTFVRLEKAIRSRKLNFRLRIYQKPGCNRPEGRNIAIKLTKTDIIAITDAGCIPNRQWLEKIVNPLIKDPTIDVVAGYYISTKNLSVFQKCLVAYTLVMPNKIKPDAFLPASRSMALRKSVWKDSGGFPKQFPLNEDYVFSRRIKELGYKIVFVKDAIVKWEPRRSLGEAFLMFLKFSLGDAHAGTIRKTLPFLMARGLIFFTLLIMGLGFSHFFLRVLFITVILYIFWAIEKNYSYINDKRAMIWLPILQITSDAAIFIGSFLGFCSRTVDKLKEHRGTIYL